MLWPTPPALPGAQAIWLKRMTPTKGAFFDLFGLGAMVLKGTPTIGNYSSSGCHKDLSVFSQKL